VFRNTYDAWRESNPLFGLFVPDPPGFLIKPAKKFASFAFSISSFSDLTGGVSGRSDSDVLLASRS
jgi:hypothetical protein